MKQIILKQLILKNFKGIKGLKIDLSKVTDILGDNGTGKTTIFDGFCWLLFDKDSQDRSKFDVQTLDTQNNVLKMVDTEVSAILHIDGVLKELKKVLRQKWQKKRGEVEPENKGNETTYFIDGAPAKQNEYKKYINEIVQENVFKLLTNPLYFSNTMKWQERRQLIFEINGDVSQEDVINSNSSLSELSELLNPGEDIENFTKRIKAKKRELVKAKEDIPARVDELKNSFNDIDFDALQFRKRGIEPAIRDIEAQLLDSSKANDAALKEKDRVYALKIQLKDMEYKASLEAQKPLQNMKQEAQNIENDIFRSSSKIDSINHSINSHMEAIKGYENDIIQLREKWTQINSRQLIFNENEFICPTCKREFEAADIETKKQEMQENFNQNKSQTLADINKTGKSLKDKSEKLKSELEEFKSQKEALIENRDKLIIHQSELNEQISNFKPSVTKTQEMIDLEFEISDFEVNVLQPVMTQIPRDLQSKKAELQMELDEVNADLALEGQNKRTSERIAELMEQEQELAQQIAELEKAEYLTEQFIKAKVDLLESEINKKFKYVSIKLFKTQVNGGVEECCEALIDGVPFSNANTASQVNAGLDIINTLSKHYGLLAPIFIDNRESVNEIISSDSQIINLIVSNDKVLKVENIEREVA